MIALGIDLGGTKIAAEIFGDDWSVVDTRRLPTPKDYDALVVAMADQIAWADAVAGKTLPVGVGAAGLVNPDSGLALTANLPASDRPFPADIAKAVGRPITYVNDCRAMALSEAVFGAGRDHRTVLALILGTGVGGGVSIEKSLMSGPTQTGGEFGHICAPAHLVAEHDLPVVRCGCGRMGCIETYLAGPGMTRIATALTGQTLTPPQVADARHTDAEAAKVWAVWLAFAADHLRALTLTVDPDVIVLAGGLSQIEGLVPDLSRAFAAAQFDGFATPPVVLAQGGDSSGARGAAYAALQEAPDA